MWYSSSCEDHIHTYTVYLYIFITLGIYEVEVGILVVSMGNEVNLTILQEYRSYFSFKTLILYCAIHCQFSYRSVKASTPVSHTKLPRHWYNPGVPVHGLRVRGAYMFLCCCHNMQQLDSCCWGFP